MLRFPLISLCLLATLTLGACGGSDDESTVAPGGIHPNEVRGESTQAFRPGPDGVEPKRGGKAVLSLLQDIDSLNPFLSSSASASEIHDLIYPRLQFEHADYYDGLPTFEYQIIEDRKIADDNLSIWFKLRDCMWSDGTPITSADVEFSVAAAKSPDVAWVGHSIVDFIKEIEIHDPRTFTVHYTKASPYNIMDINDVQVLAKHVFGKIPFAKWKGYGKWLDEAKAAAGGPFVLHEYETGQRIVLRRNPKYWDVGKPYLDEIEYKIFLDMGSMLNALLAGQIDGMSSVIPKDAAKVLDKGHLKLYTYITRSYGYAGWNCKRWPFDDKRVRQAMTYAIDRENIVDSLFYGYAQIAAPGIIRSMWASNHDIEPYPYDPDKAEELLQEAGWKKNGDGYYEKDGKVFEFTLITNAGNVVRKAITEYMQSNLDEIGVKAHPRLVDFNQMSGQLKLHNFKAYVGGWYIATKVDNKPTFHSSSVNGRFNYVNFSNPRVDEIIDQARTMDPKDPKAKLLWDEFQVILNEEQPYTMLYEPRGLVGLDKKFVNVKVPSTRWTWNIHEWWIHDE